MTYCNGPPYVTGSFHYGSLKNQLVKDYLIKLSFLEQQKIGYNEYKAKYSFNLDAKGLPTEKYLETKLKLQRNLFSDEEWINSCLKVSDEQSKRMLDELLSVGLSFKNIIKSTDKNFAYHEHKILKILFDEGKLYEDTKYVNFCFNCKTVLANAQIESGKTIRKGVLFLLPINELKETYLVPFTTNFNSILNNEGIGVGKDLIYKIYYSPKHKKNYVLFKEPEWLGSKLNDELIYVKDISSKELSECTYTFNSKKQFIIESSNVLANTSVPWLSNTATVHLSSLCAIEDADILEAKVPNIKTDAISTVKQFYDKCVNATSKTVGQLVEIIGFQDYEVAKEKSCWRCKNPAFEILSTQWFLKTESIKEQLVDFFKTIPINDQTARHKAIDFYKNSTQDWCISRQRVYNTALPIFNCTSCNLKEFILKEYENRTDYFVPFLKEKNYFCKKCNNLLKLEGHTIDVWFTAGVLPSYLNESFDTLVEGKDQIGGWFGSIAKISLLLNKPIPFKSLYFLGWILEPHTSTSNKANKMSKSSTNFDLKTLLNEVDLKQVVSNIISHATYKDQIYCTEDIFIEKKYVNLIYHFKKLVNMPIIQRQFLSFDDLKAQEELAKELNSLLRKYFLSFKEKLNSKFNLAESWRNLKTLMLEFYSRILIPLCKNLGWHSFLSKELKKVINLAEYTLTTELTDELAEEVRNWFVKNNLQNSLNSEFLIYKNLRKLKKYRDDNKAPNKETINCKKELFEDIPHYLLKGFKIVLI